jgi:hypothetical protein
MNRLQRIQRVSALFRYVLLSASSIIGIAVIVAMLSPGQDWVSIGDGHFAALWNSSSISHAALIAVMTPVAVTLLLGVYWLQRLLGEYQAGNFFTDSSMRCYVWLVWLKATSFIYSAIWPLLLEGLSAAPGAADWPVSFNAGSFVELIVLLMIVHLLKAAQQISDENKAFV